MKNFRSASLLTVKAKTPKIVALTSQEWIASTSTSMNCYNNLIFGACLVRLRHNAFCNLNGHFNMTRTIQTVQTIHSLSNDYFASHILSPTKLFWTLDDFLTFSLLPTCQQASENRYKLEQLECISRENETTLSKIAKSVAMFLFQTCTD